MRNRARRDVDAAGGRDVIVEAVAVFERIGGNCAAGFKRVSRSCRLSSSQLNAPCAFIGRMSARLGVPERSMLVSDDRRFRTNAAASAAGAATFKTTHPKIEDRFRSCCQRAEDTCSQTRTPLGSVQPLPLQPVSVALSQSDAGNVPGSRRACAGRVRCSSPCFCRVEKNRTQRKTTNDAATECDAQESEGAHCSAIHASSSFNKWPASKKLSKRSVYPADRPKISTVIDETRERVDSSAIRSRGDGWPSIWSRCPRRKMSRAPSRDTIARRSARMRNVVRPRKVSDEPAREAVACAGRVTDFF